MPLVKKPLWNYIASSAGCVAILCLVALMVELNCKFSLVFFTDKVRDEVTQNGNGLATSKPRDIEIAVLGRVFSVSSIVFGKLCPVKVTKDFQRARVSHFYAERKSVSGRLSRASGSHSLDGDATFAINETSYIRLGFVHPEKQDSTNRILLQESFSDNLPNSGNILPDNAGDNPEPSIAANAARACVTTMGQARKGRYSLVSTVMCESVAEMTTPCVKQSNKTENQDVSAAVILFQGNMTVNNRRMHGVIQGFTA